MGTKHIRHLVTELARAAVRPGFFEKGRDQPPYHAGDICKR